MSKTAQIVFGIALAGALFGCNESAESLRDDVKRLQAELEQSKQERIRLEERHAQDLEALQDALTARHRRELEDIRSTLQRTINESSRRIHALRSELAAQSAQGEADATVIPQVGSDPTPRSVAGTSAAPPISVFRPREPDLSDFIIPPAGPDPDLFPVRVESIHGAQKVIGSVTTSRLVESGEMYKDPFGDLRPVMRQEAVETKQYDHEVLFEIRNRTRSPQRVAFRAGREEQSALLAPGVATNLTVGSLRGADLQVSVGGQLRSYPVRYP